ncbi:glutamine-hydrolyzing GMP synthase, partial [Myxococcota bacterium]|nr:glutamine-hydrolyzing GMP synthase [Myxococcota bacterium]
RGQVIEPLADLYKKEVRDLGAALGIPRELLDRHPFPGPGLAVRLLASRGETPSFYDPEIARHAVPYLPEGVSATILPIPSVGVKADLRSYELPLMLHGKPLSEITDQFQTTIFSMVPSLVNKVEGINRVLVSLTGSLPRVSPRQVYMDRHRIDLLRRADHMVNTILGEMGLMKAVWQFPVVLVPLNIGEQGREMIVLRPVSTVRAMTCTVPLLPLAFYERCVEALLTLPDVGAVALDVTTKPPGTIEWE